MRILPQDYRGHHPAFPVRSDERFSGFFAFIPACALLALPAAGVSALLRRPHPWAAATKAAAYFTTGLTLLAAVDSAVKEHRARTFLRTQGIEFPGDRFWNLNGRFELDDAVVSGGLAAVLVSAFRKSPASLRGWKRYVGAFTFGGTFGLTSHLIVHALKLNPEEFEELQKSVQRGVELKKEEMKWQPLVIQAVRDQVFPAAQRASQPATIPPAPEADVLNAQKILQRAGSPVESPGPRVNGSGFISIFGPAPPGQHEPHLIEEQPGAPGPLSTPVPNYDWTSNNAIEDLEKHITQLRARRELLARESEFMWAWLAFKEAEYYNTDFETNPAAKAPLQKYLIALGDIQRQIWIDVSVVDWMISDTNKMMEQRRSAASNQEGKVTWRPYCSEMAVSRPPKRGLGKIRSLLSATDAAKTNLEQLKAETATAMTDPDFELMKNNQVYDPKKQKMVSEREAFNEAWKKLEDDLEEFTALHSAVKEVLADGEDLAKKCEERNQKKG